MMSPSRIDRLVALCPYAIGVGFLIGWLMAAGFTAMMLIGLGAMGGSLGSWRTERGLWMLAAVFLVIFGGLYVLLLINEIADIVRGQGNLDIWLALDLTVGTSLLGVVVRFLGSVMYLNHQLSRG